MTTSDNAEIQGKEKKQEEEKRSKKLSKHLEVAVTTDSECLQQNNSKLIISAEITQQKETTVK